MPFRNRIFLLIFLFFTGFVSAQNTRSQELEIGNIEQLQLNLDEVFAVEIITGDFSTIQIISEAEGEYADELQLEVKQTQQTLHISSVFDAILSSGYDKLSSHKVFAFQLKIFIPQHFQVYLQSNIARLQLEGKLAYLEANLNNGDCYLRKHEGNAKINTYRGNIHVQTKDAEVNAETRSGKLQLEVANYQNHFLELKSIEGDIEVIQLN